MLPKGWAPPKGELGGADGVAANPPRLKPPIAVATPGTPSCAAFAPKGLGGPAAEAVPTPQIKIIIVGDWVVS